MIKDLYDFTALILLNSILLISIMNYKLWQSKPDNFIPVKKSIEKAEVFYDV